MADQVVFLPADRIIPEMTDPLGRHWRQPSLNEMEISDEYARIKPNDFNELADYSHSRPTGAYFGKMWRVFDGTLWHLCWYGIHPDQNLCTIETRKIIPDFL